MAGQTADAVVIGAGPNGLVAANALVDAGWDVVVLEANAEVGGAVRSAEVTAPGFVTDLFSAFYPLAAASPVIRGLDLGAHGLFWEQAPDVLAHALDDGRAAVLSPRGRRAPPQSVDAFAPGDGEAWMEMFEQWRRIRDPLLDALFTPFPPITSTVRLLRRLGTAGTVDLARLAVTPVRRLARERFRGEGAALLLEGNAMHSDVPPDAAGSGVFGWLLAMLGQDVGFPVPRGGAQQLASSLQRRVVAGGGEVRTGARVTSVVVSGGRAVGVRLEDGTTRPRPQGGARRRGRARALPATSSARSTCRPGSCGTSTRSSGTTPRSRSTGPSTGPCPGAPRAPAAPAPCTSASTPTASSTSRPTCRWAGCRSGRSCCSGR